MKVKRKVKIKLVTNKLSANKFVDIFFFLMHHIEATTHDRIEYRIEMQVLMNISSEKT